MYTFVHATNLYTTIKFMNIVMWPITWYPGSYSV